MISKIAKDLSTYVKGNNLYLPIQSDNPLYYPIDLSFTLDNIDFYYTPFDKEGIPLKRYSSVGIQYNPTRICSYAFANINEFLNSGNPINRENFLRMADRLLDYNSSAYYYYFDWGDLKSPWMSCMAQGEAISVLVRAFLITKDTKYADAAQKSMRYLDLSIASGGLKSQLYDGSEFLEEYPSQTPQHVLNGFLYCLIGICDYHRNIAETPLFEKFSETLVKNLKLWDINGWSAYDLHDSNGKRNPATPMYHQIHISQLSYINRFLNSSEISRISSIWQASSQNPLSRMGAFMGKLIYRIRNRPQR